MKTKSKFFITSVILVILMSIGFAFYLNGSPWQLSATKRDQIRTNNINTISNQIQNFYTNYRHLPQENELTNLPTDPKTNKKYEYLIDSETRYKICAVFEVPTKSSVDDAQILIYPPPLENQPRNSSGRFCYSFSVQSLQPRTITPQIPPQNSNIDMLYGHWLLSDEPTSLSYKDTSGNNFHGKSSDQIFPITRFTNLNAPNFDGKHRINLGNLPSSTQGTLAMWIEPLSDQQPSNAFYPAYGAGGFFGRQVNEVSSSLIFSFKSPTDLTPMFLLGNRPDTTLTPLAAKTSLKPNLWQHVAATWNITNSKVKIYVNGVLSAETNKLNPDPGNGEVDLGGIRSNMNGRFVGAISDVYYYGRELSDGEIAELAISR